MTRPWPINCVEINFHIERESSETSIYVWIDTQVGSERVLPSWWFESLIWGLPSGFPLPNHLALPGFESGFGLSQGPPMCVSALSWPRWFLWVVDITYYEVTPSPFFDFRGAFLPCVVGKVSLTSRMRNMWSFISYRSKAWLLTQGPICLLPQACNSNAHPLETSEKSPTCLVIPFLHVYNGANRSIPNVSGCSED